MNKRWAGPAVTLALAGMVACGGSSYRVPMPPLGPTLEIVNQSGLVYRVTVSPGTVVQVYPGQSKCVRVGKFHEARTIEFFALAGSVRHRTPPENLMSAPGWVVEVGELPRYDLLALRPAKPCDV